ncbi:hypothetical protein H2248_008109 [Termitomyces sp. 'cryptogamus']|nr:hypothetical protein H2248_008109 [Termitomyces sp. 'cryptogamus']
MGVCSGCAILFRNLAEEKCMKCKKLSKASSAVEREAIEAEPQCEVCSVVFPFMKNVLCGAYRERELLSLSSTASSTSTTADEILSRTAIFQASANQHRLNQPMTKNKGLQAAEAARIKAKITCLQKQAKADVVTVEATFFYYPKNGNAAKKAQLLPDFKKYFGSDSAKSLLDGTRNTLAKTWSTTPSANINGLKLNFEDMLKYRVWNCDSKSVINFKPTEEHLAGTFDAMYSGLRSESKVSDGDFKDRKLSLRVYAHEVLLIVDDEDLYYQSAQLSACHSVARSMSRNQTSTKHKASGSLSATTEYTSAFLPRKLLQYFRLNFIDMSSIGPLSPLMLQEILLK